MRFHNPELPWKDMARRLAGTPMPPSAPEDFLPKNDGDAPPPARTSPESSSPGRSRAYAPQPGDPGHVPYAELHAHTHFSFLDGASSPASLITQAAALGLTGIAITDHDGFYGAPQFAEAADAHPGLKTVYGAELSLGLTRVQAGNPDPEGDHLLVLARGKEGYHRLASAITHGQLAHTAEKGRPIYDLEKLADMSGGHWQILSGCRKSAVRRALEADGISGALSRLSRLGELFGEANIAVELHHGANAEDDARNDALVRAAARLRLPVVATGNVHYARPEEHRLAAALAATRARRSLDEADGWLPPGPAYFVRSGAEMARRFGHYRDVDGVDPVARSVLLAEDLAFELRAAKPRLPKIDLPDGHTQMSHLRALVFAGAERKYPGMPEHVTRRLEHELAVIEKKDFPGYFLIVYDIVKFARSKGILCQGRGSAANSVVCYVLDITAVDPIVFRLPFERFLNSVRDEEPDIDVDFDSERREEVIQEVYRRYGRLNAAQVCNVVTYRPRNAVRDMAKALGYSTGQQDAWSKQLENVHGDSFVPENSIPRAVQDLVAQLDRYPRHLGIHSGGMVLTEQPVSEICPVENARMENRTVLQWDKDDCAYMGLVKFDLLGLGMLAAIQRCFDFAAAHCGESWDLDAIPKEEAAVYDQLCLADSIGVFQVESRAQLGLSPRLRPRRFEDLVIQVALIRPGPIQGNAVHPYLLRRHGKVPVTYPHPRLEPILERTCGIPIFQEQIMQMAMAVADCNAEDADLLRRAMGSKRGVERIDSVRTRLYAGMSKNGITGQAADTIYEQVKAFANFGFAESHACSFSLLVYASAWLRLHYPAAFLAALLNSQPMGFYAPHTLVEDARRHGVTVRRPSLVYSGAEAGLEPIEGPDLAVSRADPGGLDACCERVQAPVGPFDPDAPHDFAAHRRDAQVAVRLGLSSIKSISDELAERIVAERERGGHYASLTDLARRVEMSAAQLEALAEAGAVEEVHPGRRSALWEAGLAAREKYGQLPGTSPWTAAPQLPLFNEWDTLITDLRTTGLSVDDHPLRHARGVLAKSEVYTVQDLSTVTSQRRIKVAGLVRHRQRPATANHTTFLNLEDETGMVNVVCSQGAWKRYREVVRNSKALIVRGILERSDEGVINVLADRFEALELAVPHKSRDFQ